MCVSQWCKRWRVSINFDKSKVIHFRNKRSPRSNEVFEMDQHVLEYVHEYKYLGVMLNEHMDFQESSSHLSASASRSFGGIVNKFRDITDMGFGTFWRAVEACVYPILNYASESWGYKEISHAENIQNKILRFYLGVHRFTPIAGILGDFGEMPVQWKRWVKMLAYWNRLVLMDDSRLTKKVFMYDYSVCKNNWTSEIKCIFDLLQLQGTFENMETCDVNMVKKKLLDIYVEKWNSDVQRKPKLCTYNIFKTEFELENYVKLNLNRKNRSLLAQFRLGVLPLRIETGRFVNLKREQRICTLCETGAIEDEMHFLLHCNLYDDLRPDLLEHLPVDLTNEEKLKTLIRLYPRRSANYIEKAFRKRSDVIYNM